MEWGKDKLKGVWASEAVQSAMYVAPIRVPLTIFKATCFVAKVATSPLWLPLKMIYKSAAWGLNHIENKNARNAIIASALTLGTGYGASFLAAATYGGTYGAVAGSDFTPLDINWPASKGTLTGQIVRFSHKGVAPCDSWEGVLQKSGFGNGYAKNSAEFSVRKYQTEMIQAVHEAQKSGREITMDYYDSWLAPETFGGHEDTYKKLPDAEKDSVSKLARCIQHTDHTPFSITYTPNP